MAQEMFRTAKHVDLDGDGIGECGTLGELTASDPLRGHARAAPLDPPLISRGLRPLGPHGSAYRGGYRYRLFLPGADGTWLRVDEDPTRRDVDAAEVRWCAFAWPALRGDRTFRVFRVDETGRITATGAKVDPSRFPRMDVSDWVEVR